MEGQNQPAGNAPDVSTFGLEAMEDESDTQQQQGADNAKESDEAQGLDASDDGDDTDAGEDLDADGSDEGEEDDDDADGEAVDLTALSPAEIAKLSPAQVAKAAKAIKGRADDAESKRKETQSRMDRNTAALTAQVSQLTEVVQGLVESSKNPPKDPFEGMDDDNAMTVAEAKKILAEIAKKPDAGTKASPFLDAYREAENTEFFGIEGAEGTVEFIRREMAADDAYRALTTNTARVQYALSKKHAAEIAQLKETHQKELAKARKQSDQRKKNLAAMPNSGGGNRGSGGGKPSGNRVGKEIIEMGNRFGLDLSIQ